jgi:hypothetical protein
MGVLILVTAIPAMVVYFSMMFIFASPLLAIVPAGIIWWMSYWGFSSLSGN